MYNSEKVQAALIGLAGLRQTDDSDFPTLNNSVAYDGTNLMISHPLLSIENIDMSVRNYSLYYYALWDVATPYAAGIRIKYNDVVYESLTSGNTGNAPDVSPTNWEIVNVLSLYLEDRFKTSAISVVNDVLNAKKIAGQTKTLLSNVRLTHGGGSFQDKVINDGSLVGIELSLKHIKNIKAVINRIGLQFTEPNVGLNMYLYHSSQLEPIATYILTYGGVGSVEWVTNEIELKYDDSLYDVGGRFYLMYDQDQMSGQAIKKRVNWDRPPCASCNRYNMDAYNLYSRYFNIRVVKVPAADRNGTSLWNVEQTKYITDNNYGLNLEVTAECDITDFIIKQKKVFAVAFRDAVTISLMRDIIYSTRNNHVNEKLQLMARAELQNEKIGGLGLLDQYNREVSAVDFEISALDSVCLPCNKKAGLKLGTSGLRNW